MIKEIFKKKIPISANRFLNIKDIQGNFLYTTVNSYTNPDVAYIENQNYIQTTLEVV